MNKRLNIPVLALRGREDAYILESVTAASAHWAAQWDDRAIDDAGHFVHEENPAAVNAALLELLLR